MKLAILSDIHANLEALEKSLQYIDNEIAPGKIIFLGDTVGYGADPVECVQKIRERADISILGNHDAAAVKMIDIDNFNPDARESALWTRGTLSDEDKLYLKGLPYRDAKWDFHFTHSAPHNPEQWKYIYRWNDTKEEFDYFEEQFCFLGHSHIPGIYGRDKSLPHENGPVQLDQDDRYIINVGSVGQPRDGDNRLSFAVFDSDSTVLEIVRLEYDITTARQKIIDSNLPEYLGDRLINGR